MCLARGQGEPDARQGIALSLRFNDTRSLGSVLMPGFLGSPALRGFGKSPDASVPPTRQPEALPYDVSKKTNTLRNLRY